MVQHVAQTREHRWRLGSEVMAKDTMSAVLTDFALTMVTDFPITRILDHLVLRIADVLPISSAGVSLIAPGQDPRYVAASDPDAHRFEQLQDDMAEGPCRLACESGLPVLAPDLAHDERFPGFAPAAVGAGLAAVFAFPLSHGPERFGALDLYRWSPGPLDADALASAATLANVAAVYITNAAARDQATRHSREMQDLAHHDPLTGLPNMLLLRQRLAHAASRARRSRASAAVLFIDLDAFKLVNDAHGHQTGDRLLVAVANRLAMTVRPGDTLARIHGDEFVLLCEDVTGEGDAAVLVTRVQGLFDEPFVVAGITLHVSASVGIAFAGPGEQVSEELVGQADQAMYAHKRERTQASSQATSQLR